ncbi:MAG: hypothetical protein AAGG68_00950 [Bacteroidota bacterium]
MNSLGLSAFIFRFSSLLLLCCLPLLCAAQKRQKFRTPVSDVTSTWNYAYFGERNFHPGIRVSYDYPFLANKITKEKQWKGGRVQTRSFRRIYRVSGNAAAFYHPKNTTGLLLFSSLERQKTGKKNWTRAIGFSLGYIHTFRNGQTYLAKENGNFEEIVGQQGSALLGLQAGLIRDRIRLGKANFNWYVKANIFIQAPFNNALTLRDFLEIGVSVPIKQTTSSDR